MKKCELNNCQRHYLLFFQPFEGGAGLKGTKLSKDEFKQAIATYYQMMGWDETGVPTKAKLEELDVGWVAEKLKK